MDASQYKDYVLVLLFVKYVSDKYAGDSYPTIVIPEGGSFKDMVALKGKKDIGEGINKIIAELAKANDLKGVIDVADFDNADKLGKGKEMVDRLSNLVGIFQAESLDFSKNKAEGDDILGDAYEYLMRHFATESGKSKGQFYTPAEVSRVIAKVIGVSQTKSQDQTIYDPTCGSGSLLLKAADESHQGVTIYGQEMDNATAALAKMNMILHGNPTAEIWQDNTLSQPHFKNGETLKTFDFAVANPPFSAKAWSNGFDPANDLYDRFSYGIPPAKNGDYAFLLHLIRSLKSKGKGAIILPHGVLFRGNVEAEIRKNIVCNGIIKGIIGLPANLFYGTGIPACIIVVDKENADNPQKCIFMIDASKGFVKDGNKNRLREQDIHKIVDVFNKQSEVPKYARKVPVDEIEQNEYNLNIPRYIDSQEPEDRQDIEAHLLGDIPRQDIDDLDKYWRVCPSLKDALFTKSTRYGYLKLKISEDEIKHTIFAHPEFVCYIQAVNTAFRYWQKLNAPILERVGIGTKPKEVIRKLSDGILLSFADINLVDKYDVYQHLMTYWLETMQDDAHLIAVDGWNAEISQVKGKKDEWDCDLLPKQLVINRYFAAEQKVIAQLEADCDAISRHKEAMEEEHSGEDGLLEEVKTEKGKISRGNVQKRIKEIKNDVGAIEELEVLNAYLELMELEAGANKKIKDAQKAQDKKVIVRYKALTEDEVKIMVVDDKWLAAISGDVNTEVERISQRLTQRIKELAERYATPMPAMNAQVDELEMKVNGHLEKMGFVWT